MKQQYSLLFLPIVVILQVGLQNSIVLGAGPSGVFNQVIFIFINLVVLVYQVLWEEEEIFMGIQNVTIDVLLYK